MKKQHSKEKLSKATKVSACKQSNSLAYAVFAPVLETGINVHRSVAPKRIVLKHIGGGQKNSLTSSWGVLQG